MANADFRLFLSFSVVALGCLGVTPSCGRAGASATSLARSAAVSSSAPAAQRPLEGPPAHRLLEAGRGRRRPHSQAPRPGPARRAAVRPGDRASRTSSLGRRRPAAPDAGADRDHVAGRIPAPLARPPDRLLFGRRLLHVDRRVVAVGGDVVLGPSTCIAASSAARACGASSVTPARHLGRALGVVGTGRDAELGLERASESSRSGRPPRRRRRRSARTPARRRVGRPRVPGFGGGDRLAALGRLPHELAATRSRPTRPRRTRPPPDSSSGSCVSLLMSTRQPVSRAASRAFWPSLPIASDSWKSGTMTSAVPVSSWMRTSRTRAGASAFMTNSGGSSLYGTMSTFSPRSSLTTMRTREPRAPTHAPTGSTLWSFDATAIFVR